MCLLVFSGSLKALGLGLGPCIWPCAAAFTTILWTDTVIDLNSQKYSLENRTVKLEPFMFGDCKKVKDNYC